METDRAWTDLKPKLQGLSLPYEGVIDKTRECRIIPDCPITGSGICTVSMDASDSGLTYFITRSDFWVNSVKEGGSNGFGYPHYSVKPAPLGRLRLSCSNQIDDAVHSQDMSEASITSVLAIDGGSLTATLVPVAQDDTIIVKLSATVETECGVALEADTQNPLCFTMEGETDGILWAAKELTSVLINNACIAAKVLGSDRVARGEDEKLKPCLGVAVKPGRDVCVVLSVKGAKDEYGQREEAIATVADCTAADVASALDSNAEWWQAFWQKSSIDLDDKEIMRFYHGALYALACCCPVEGRTPPGLAGGWIQTSDPIWGGNYTMNYNGESPFWGLISSNHQELGMPYVRMVHDFIPRGRILARELNHNGIVMPVMIEPWGITDHPDALYQKSNASLAAVYLINYYFHTHDDDFMRDWLYPYITELVAFWEGNLPLKDGRYTIQDSTARERLPGDLNPGPELGYVRLVFKAALKGSEVLGVDADKRAQWQDYLDRLSDYPTTFIEGKRTFKETENRRAVSMHDKGDNPVCMDHVYPGEAACTPANQLLTRNTIDYLETSWTQENSFPRIFCQAVRGKYDPEAILKHLKSRFTLGPYPHETLRNNSTISPQVHGIESVGAIEAINAMLVRDNGYGIEIFNNWPMQRNAAFTNLRVDGAFLVSAGLESGAVKDVAIVSEKGLACVVYNPWPGKAVTVVGSDGSEQVLQGVKLRFATTPETRYELAPAATLYELNDGQLAAKVAGQLQVRSLNPGSGTRVLLNGDVVAESKEEVVSFSAEAGTVYGVEEIPLPLLANPIISEQFRSVKTDCQDTLDILFETVDGECTLQFELEMSDGSVVNDVDSVTYRLSRDDVIEIASDHVVKPLAAGKCEIAYTVTSHGTELSGKLIAQVLSAKVVRGVTATTGLEFASWHAGMNTPDCVVEGDGMSGADVTDTHRPNPYSIGVFSIALSEEETALLVFDLQRKVELDEMWLWNYNCPDDNYRRLWWKGGSAVGIRDARIYTSLDNDIWTEIDNGGRPFRFARNSGEDKCLPASNLDGSGEPLKFNGAKVRYVKIVPVPERYVGNWGAETVGVSQVRFTEV
jgi:alpha-L-fucosidase 2